MDNGPKRTVMPAGLHFGDNSLSVHEGTMPRKAPEQSRFPWMDSGGQLTTGSPPTRKWTLGAVRVWLRKHIDVGVTCPCCGQHAKVYKRPLNSSMAYVLILMSKAHQTDPRGYFHVPSYLNGVGLKPGVSAAIRGDWAKLLHWDLIKPKPETRDDGSNRTGHWRVTELGMAFVHERVRVMSHVKIYNSKCIGLAGEHIYIHEALGKRFNYEEVMGDASDNPIHP